MAVLRLSGDDIGDVVSQAVSGEYWLCLPCHLVNKWLRNAVINTTLAICLIALSWLISLVLCLLNIITIIWLQRFSSEISGTMGLLKWWNELPWCPSWRHNQTLDELVPECREMCSLLAAVVGDIRALNPSPKTTGQFRSWSWSLQLLHLCRCFDENWKRTCFGSHIRILFCRLSLLAVSPWWTLKLFYLGHCNKFNVM